MKGLGKITGACLLGAAAFAVAGSLSLVGCSKDSSSWWSPASREVEATLPSLAVAGAVTVEPMGSRALTAGAADDAGTAVSSFDNDGLFTVSLGPDEGMRASAAAASPATRADVALANVWVLQFDASGATRACVRVGTVAAGQKVKAALLSGEGYTVWIVANGPAAGGLTTTNPATLADFESKMLYTATPASDELIPLSGKLTNVKVLDNGQVLVGSDNTVVPEVTLSRAMARVDLLLEYNVSGAELDGVWLYQVPAGACYGLDPEATDFPASGDASNFGHRDGYAAGLAPKSSGSGTVTHTWYVGDNRRGQVPSILWEKNKGEKNAPKMATYARIKSHESADETQALFHDVYLGENVTTDFDVKRNRHYIYRVRIGGTLDQQKVLAQNDDRVWAGTPEYLDGAPAITPSLDDEIHPNGQTFKVSFSGYWTGTGIPVRATVVDGDKLAEGSALCNGNTGEATLKIPENESGAARQIVFEYQWKGGWIVIGVGTQGGYGVTDGEVTPARNIPAAGGAYSITLYGSFPAEGVKIRARTESGTSLMTGTVFKANTPVDLTVPPNTGAERTVVFEYEWEGQWIEIERRTQAAGSVTGATISPDPSGGFSADATTFTVKLTGYLGSGIEVQARISGQTSALVSATATVSGTGVTLKVPANSYPNAARTIVFGYVEGGEFKEIKRGTQAEGSLIGELYGGGVIYWVDPDDENNFRVVALDEAPSASDLWAASESYVLGSGAQDQTARNGADVWKIAQSYSDNMTDGASGTFATDFPAFSYCYEKTDGGVSKGTWYLPSKQELLDLYSAKGSVESVITDNGGTAFSARNYWSATESSSSNAWRVHFSNGGTYSNIKTFNSHVRCVRNN